LAEREQESDLRADAGHPPLEVAELGAGAAVGGQLLELSKTGRGRRC
jgi:hypothetical protein